MLRVIIKLNILVFIFSGLFSSVSYADHGWSTYHWERSSNPLVLELGDNIDSGWDFALLDASVDWSVSTMINTTVVPGTSNPRRCKAQSGNVQVCNLNYGNNGWLGIAGISVSGGHIKAGYVKLNDTYFDTAKYDTPEWRKMVTCQEVGHTFGLGHQDEEFGNANLNSCMDYTNLPESNQRPNEHDRDQLGEIYAHLDVVDGGDSSAKSSCNPKSPKCNPAVVPTGWGKLVSKHGPQEVFELDLGNGNKVITHVTWTIEHAEKHQH